MEAGNFITWTGLNYNSVKKYCPKVDETVKDHMAHTHQGMRLTKATPTPPPAAEPDIVLPATKSN